MCRVLLSPRGVGLGEPARGEGWASRQHPAEVEFVVRPVDAMSDVGEGEGKDAGDGKEGGDVSNVLADTSTDRGGEKSTAGGKLPIVIVTGTLE